MCFRPRTWMRLRILVFLILFLTAMALWSWGMSAQSQDGINAGLAERMNNNTWRILQLESRMAAVEALTGKMNWMLGVLCGQLGLKLIELWRARPGTQEAVPSIRERRSYPPEE